MFTREKNFIYSEIICNKNTFKLKETVKENNNKANNKKEEEKVKRSKINLYN